MTDHYLFNFSPASKTVQDILNSSDVINRLVIGYGLAAEIKYNEKHTKKSPVVGGMHYSNAKFRSNQPNGLSVTMIDLDDFNDDGTPKYLTPIDNKVTRELDADIRDRTFNIARTFEHELFGHGVYKILDGNSSFDIEEKDIKTANDVENVFFRKPMNLPRRITYGNRTFTRKRLFRPFSKGVYQNTTMTQLLMEKNGQYIVFKTDPKSSKRATKVIVTPLKYNYND